MVQWRADQTALSEPDVLSTARAVHRRQFKFPLDYIRHEPTSDVILGTPFLNSEQPMIRFPLGAVSIWKWQ